MSTTYAVTATRSTTDEHGWSHIEQVPTFYLDANVQGITSEAHAERIARAILAHPYGRTAVSVVAL